MYRVRILERNRDLWYDGVITGSNKGVYTFRAKVYETGSVYGIDDGRISKLEIRDPNNVTIVDYERTWVKEPKSEEGIKVLQSLKKAFGE